MVKKSWLQALLLWALLYPIPATVNATTFLRLQSTYLGDGWFQYEMDVLNDPFFSEADITDLRITSSNEIDHSTDSTNWVNYNWDNSSSYWHFNSSYPTRPYEETFLVRSSETSYKLGVFTNLQGAIFFLSLYGSDFAPTNFSKNIVGYAWVPCLIPCSPEEADNSPTNFVYDLKLLPDIEINQLIQTNGEFHGVDFTWDDESTFVLQGTADFLNWTNIAYIWSYPPETVWTTNISLGDYGQFFRIALVAGGHSSSLPPLSSSLVLAPKTLAKANVASTTPRVTSCKPADSNVVVSLATKPNQPVQVQAIDAHGTVYQTQLITPQGTSATVNFTTVGLPNPVFFQVVPVQ
ncbi:MAG: hypothetical protein ABSD77_02620 [Verrucomicrobiota bacterium]|jgi:hypothetical protein